MSFKNPFTVLRIGLALVFLANALVALFTPQEYRGVVEASFLATMFPMISSAILVKLILINDSLLFLTFLFNLKFIKYALIWASIYLIVVMLVLWQPIDGLEHLGFLSIAIALYLNLKQQPKIN